MQNGSYNAELHRGKGNTLRILAENLAVLCEITSCNAEVRRGNAKVRREKT